MHARTRGLGPRRRRPRQAVLGVLAAILAGPAAAGAVECGEVLTEDTVLEVDLLNCPGDGLVVGAGGIRIDLGGHLLQGSGSWPNPGTAGIRNEGHHDVEIRNGRIVRFDHGVHLADVTGNRIEGLMIGGIRATFKGIVLVGSDQNSILGNDLSGYSEELIALIDSHRNRVEANKASGADGHGIVLRGADYNEV